MTHKDYTPSFSRDDITIRPARPEDRQPLEAIAAQTWDGHDYLPEVFDQWLDDTDGTFDVLTVRNEVVGVAKLTLLGENEWWLEGLRIDPHYQGQGLARILHHYKVRQARQLGEGVIRFATSSLNDPIHKLALETGFQIAATYAFYRQSALETDHSALRQLSLSDRQTVYDWLEDSNYFEKAQRSFEYRWTWRIASPERISEYLERGGIYGWYLNESDRLQGLLVVSPPDRTTGENPVTVLRVAYGEVVTVHGDAFWQAIRGLAYTLGADEVRVKVINEEAIVAPFVVHNWERREWDAVLFSRPLDMTEASTIEASVLSAVD